MDYFGEISAKTLRTPKNFRASTPMDGERGANLQVKFKTGI